MCEFPEFRFLDQLSERYRRVLELRYGLNGEHEHTLEEIGQEFHITRQRVRQIVVVSLQKLRQAATNSGSQID